MSYTLVHFKKSPSVADAASATRRAASAMKRLNENAIEAANSIRSFHAAYSEASENGAVKDGHGG